MDGLPTGPAINGAQHGMVERAGEDRLPVDGEYADQFGARLDPQSVPRLANVVRAHDQALPADTVSGLRVDKLQVEQLRARSHKVGAVAAARSEFVTAVLDALLERVILADGACTRAAEQDVRGTSVDRCSSSRRRLASDSSHKWR